MISKSIGIPVHFEVIVISVIAICVLSLDVSISTLQENLQEIWNYEFGENVQQEDVEVYLKYSLSGVVLLKALTLHLFLALHFLLLWAATVEEKPNLVLPWLLLGLFRSIFLNFLGFSTGLYVCLIQTGYYPVCMEYVLAQAIQHGPEVYAWLSIFRNVITESAIENVINNIKRTKPMQCSSRSLDTLVNLKSSNIRKNYYEIEDGHESIPEKVMRILNVVYDDIKKARIAKEKRLPWKITDLNLEKLLVSDRRHPNIYTHNQKNKQISSLEKRRTSSVESVYQEAITNEIELRCISLDGSNTSSFHSENKDSIHHARNKNAVL